MVRAAILALFPSSRGKHTVFHHKVWCQHYNFCRFTLSSWGNSLLDLFSSEVFFLSKMLNFFSKKFCIYRYDYVIFLPYSNIGITLYNLHMLNQPRIPGINPIWSYCIILFIKCQILFANIFLRFLYPHSWQILVYSFSSFLLSLSGFSIKAILAL